MEEHDLQRALALRFRKIRGQLLAVARMVTSGHTNDMLIQLLAVKAALDQASLLVMENHVRHCMGEGGVSEGDPAPEVNLMHFIRSYKTATLTPAGREVTQTALLLEAAERTGNAVGLIESFDSGRCSEVLGETAAVRARLDEVAFRILEDTIQVSLREEDGSGRKELFSTIRMARKFIF